MVNSQGAFLALGMARPPIRLDLPPQDKAILQSWLRASNTKRILAERAQMILLCGEGFTASEVSQELSKRLGSIQKWRKRYLDLGLSGLEDQPRSGRPRRLAIEGTNNSQGHRADHPQGIDSLEPAPHGRVCPSQQTSGD